MKNEQDVHEINPATMIIITNLRQKAYLEKLDSEYYINLMTECLHLKYGFKKSLMALIEGYGQEWCIFHGIFGNEWHTVRCNIKLQKRR